MRKYLLSLMVAVMGIALLGATTYAYERLSVKSENTFEFYENEFDFMLMPSKLAGQDSTLGEGHKLVEGFSGYRLFTNLTNQAGDDTYQIGGIIPIPGGMGNVGILFDYRKDEGNGLALDCVNCGKAYLYDDIDDSSIVSRLFLEEDRDSDYDYTDLAPYDASFLDKAGSDTVGPDDYEDEAWNLYLAYGLPIPGTPFSVGLSYAYGSIDGSSDSSLYSHSIDDTTLETSPGSAYDTYTDSSSESDWEYETHEIALEGRYNASPLDSLLGFSWRMVDGDNSIGSRSATGTSLTERSFAGAPIPPEVIDNVAYSNYSGTDITTNSEDNFFPFCGYGNREGDKWSIYTENIFELNPTVAFGLDLAYRWGDYDDNLDGVGTRDVTESGTNGTSTKVNQTGSIEYDRDTDLDGDIDNDELFVRTELRLTFPRVRFGLGVSYDNFQEDGDYSGTSTETFTIAYDDGTVSSAADYTRVGSGSSSEEIDYEIDQETWRFPVATEFNITDRLVCRLGVEFVFGEWELDVEKTTTENADHTWLEKNGAGRAVDGGYYEDPETLTSFDKDATNSTPDPYDPDKNVTTWSLKDDDTFSETIYNVGLGYQVTENLNVDAMWRHIDWQSHDEHAPTQREGVGSDYLFVGATLAF